MVYELNKKKIDKYNKIDNKIIIDNKFMKYFFQFLSDQSM